MIDGAAAENTKQGQPPGNFTAALSSHMKNFENAEFVIFDVETTGLSPRLGDRVIEVAALKIKALKIVEVFESLINPGQEIPLTAMIVNGITPEMLSDAPQAAEVWPALLDFLSGRIIVGHNIKFDLSFIKSEAALCGLSWNEAGQSICTVKMAKVFLPDLGRYPLWLLAQILEIDSPQLHRALADCHMTFNIFLKLLALADRRDVTDIFVLTKLFGAKSFKANEWEFQNVKLIKQAIESSRHVHLTYFSQTQGAMTFRKIHPRRLDKYKGIPVVVGYCHLSCEERSFRTDRIFDVRVEIPEQQIL